MYRQTTSALFAVAALLGSVQAMPAEIKADARPATTSSPLRNAYFGDLHLHTTYSFDAYLMMGTQTTPDQAYKFARGQTISYQGHPVRRAWPLDFMAVTDHAENIGVFNQLDDPHSAFAKSEVGRLVREKGPAAFWDIVRMIEGRPMKPFDPQAAAAAWQREIDAANANNDPDRFTAFIGYEWTTMAQTKYNLHRNVIFRGDRAPFPFSALDSQRPEDLWSYLEVNRKHGIEALAIPHNGNASGGLMYDWNDSDGRPIDQAYAMRRAENEPLTEISQGKGQSETVPELSPTDEQANFEIFDYLLVGHEHSAVHGSYVREAYGRGLVLAQRTGTNPYKLGVVGGTDFHNGLSTSDENAFAGGSFGIDPTANVPSAAALEKTFAPRTDTFDLVTTGSGSLTGVWAERNTRDSIYAALRRKETFATSGTRLKFRFFGGWQYAKGMLRDEDWTRAAYAQGVPMGGDLPAKPAAAKSPRFLVWALKDPDGAPLDRVQIVKVSLKDATYAEKVFDVAWSGDARVPDPKTGKLPPVGNTVDLKTATYENSIGASELSTVWEDPEFDAKTPAVYYLRVIEIPTPRWSTIMAVKAGLPLPASVPADIQERGWSSPIWFTPGK